MPKYSYTINRPTATMTVYEDGRTLCIAHDITRAANLRKTFYNIVYEFRGINLAEGNCNEGVYYSAEVVHPC